jgi:hypothetical protein
MRRPWISGKDFPQVPLDKENKLKEGLRKAWGRGVCGGFLLV